MRSHVCVKLVMKLFDAPVPIAERSAGANIPEYAIHIPDDGSCLGYVWYFAYVIVREHAVFLLRGSYKFLPVRKVQAAIGQA